ncbi:MAG: mechanosensitive ion channel protein MscS [Halobacteriovoraceae bacterium]|nr:mechanosensitive ion channel protein MscS [Halobacteriovoraceae bacterium]
MKFTTHKMALLFSILTLFLFTQAELLAEKPLTYPSRDFSSPRSTFNYFLKTMKGYKLGDKDAIDLAVRTLNLKSIPRDAKTLVGEQNAVKLINTLDHLEYVDIETIPGSDWVESNPNKKTWVYKTETIEWNKETYNVEISLENTATEKQPAPRWLFSEKTMETIALYERVVKKNDLAKGVTAYSSWKENLKNQMPEWTAHQSFILMNGQWMGLFALILLAYIIERIIRLYLAKLIVHFLAKSGIQISSELNRKFTLPMGIILFTAMWTLGVQLLELDYQVLSWFLKGAKVAFTFGCVLAFYQLVDLLCLYLEKKAQISENKFDDILVPLVRKSLKTFVVAVGIIAVGDALSLDMKGLLAGMGIAGLGVSLAAKDTISNLFGSLTVLLDRPFRIGDWVNIDNGIEGTVEEVGLRSCRIRTFYNSLITIPNGMLTNAHIDNYGMRQFRRYTTNLGVQYDTPVEKIEAFCEGIREIIRKHPHTRKDYYHVYLNGLGASSLNILLYVFFITPDWADELKERHRLIMDILRLGKEMGIQFAFPTQTLHMIPGENTKYDGLPPDLSAERIQNYTSEKVERLF